jgi:hypothetical protein
VNVLEIATDYFLSLDASHVDLEFCGKEIDELLETLDRKLVLVLCDFDDFDSEFGKDEVADVEVSVSVAEDLFVFDVARVTCVEGDVLHHLHHFPQ